MYCAVVDLPAIVQNLGDMMSMPPTSPFHLPDHRVQKETASFFIKMKTITDYFNDDVEVFMYDGELCKTTFYVIMHAFCGLLAKCR